MQRTAAEVARCRRSGPSGLEQILISATEGASSPARRSSRTWYRCGCRSPCRTSVWRRRTPRRGRARAPRVVLCLEQWSGLSKRPVSSTSGPSLLGKARWPATWCFSGQRKRSSSVQAACGVGGGVR
ncbi:hypothetical protein SEVIR_3G334151v4 [Setaria viridis]